MSPYRKGEGFVRLPLLFWGRHEQFRLDEIVRRRLASLNDPRKVIADPNARYAGAKIGEKTRLPAHDARLGEIRFEIWLTSPAARIPTAHHQPTGVAVGAKEKESHKRAS
jgi:hypothetical protein